MAKNVNHLTMLFNTFWIQCIIRNICVVCPIYMMLINTTGLNENIISRYFFGINISSLFLQLILNFGNNFNCCATQIKGLESAPNGSWHCTDNNWHHKINSLY